MAGALTERDFVTKLEKAAFRDVRIHGRQPLGIDDLALYPLFTPELLGLMRTHIDPAAQSEIGVAVVLSARARRDDDDPRPRHAAAAAWAGALRESTRPRRKVGAGAFQESAG